MVEHYSHKIQNTIFCDAIAAGSSIQMETDENGIFIHITSYTDLFDIINEYIYKAILNNSYYKLRIQLVLYLH